MRLFMDHALFGHKAIVMKPMDPAVRAALIRWLSSEERKDRRMVDTHTDAFERGYHLGRAHACSETVAHVRAMKASRKKP